MVSFHITVLPRSNFTLSFRSAGVRAFDGFGSSGNLIANRKQTCSDAPD